MVPFANSLVECGRRPMSAPDAWMQSTIAYNAMRGVPTRLSFHMAPIDLNLLAALDVLLTNAA